MSRDDTPVLLERDGSIATVRLNRPDRLNAVSLPLYRALGAALDELAEDAAIRAVVITGSGRAFCVGADLKAHGSGESSAEERGTYVETGQRTCRRLQELPKPVIAAVNGHAIGAGLELALSCDLLVIAAEAKLRFPELALGTFVGGGVVYTLAQRVGLARAKELILLGEFFRGGDAAAMGLANRVVPAAEVLPTAAALAAELAKRAPIPVARAKRLLNQAWHLDAASALELEGQALLECMGTRDWREGIEAFHARRDPEFRGE